MKKIVIVSAGIILLLSLVIIIIAVLANKNRIAKPSLLVSPTPIPIGQQLQVTPAQKQETLQNLSVIGPIKLEFDEKVDPNSLVYTIEPYVKTFEEFDMENKRLTIKPIDYWKPNADHVLTITSLKTQSGKILPTYIVRFRAVVEYDFGP